MLKNIVRLEVRVAEKIYHLLCDNDSPINDVKEAIFQFTKIVCDIEEKIKESQKPAPKQEKVSEPEAKTEEV